MTGNGSTTDYTATLKVTDKYGNVAQTNLHPGSDGLADPTTQPSFTVSPASGAAATQRQFQPSASTAGRPEVRSSEIRVGLCRHLRPGRFEGDHHHPGDPDPPLPGSPGPATSGSRSPTAGRSASTNRMVTVNPPPVPTPAATFTFTPGKVRVAPDREI
ncbi:MAG: hypothetical protein R2735_13010 [Microthrixaceae bacterium]